MRWMVLNMVGCALWLAGLAYAKGLSLPGALSVPIDGQHAATGLGVGVLGLFLLMWVNLLDAS